MNKKHENLKGLADHQLEALQRGFSVTGADGSLVTPEDVGVNLSPEAIGVELRNANLAEENEKLRKRLEAFEGVKPEEVKPKETKALKAEPAGPNVVTPAGEVSPVKPDVVK